MGTNQPEEYEKVKINACQKLKEIVETSDTKFDKGLTFNQ